jgi:hypothetical protein
VNQAGVIGFYRPVSDYYINGLQEGGALKIVKDNSFSTTDAHCKTAPYDIKLVDETNGPSEQTARTSYSGRTNSANDNAKLIFNNGLLTTKTIIKLAGVIAICYCPQPSATVPSGCIDDGWIVSLRTTIRGPKPGQFWQFSTHVVFRLNYTGWGLSPDDKVRIIPRTLSCSDNNNNPSGAYTSTNMKVQCPHPCSEIGAPTSKLNGDLSQNVLSDSTYECNDQNEGCRKNDIKLVTVLDEHATKVDFESPHGLVNGDLISLHRNIQCDPADLSCTDEQLAALKGTFTLCSRCVFCFQGRACPGMP